MNRHDQALHFRRLHESAAGAILVLPNAWDAMSARIVEEAGAPAVATTSSGVSWSLGRPDGHGLTRREMADAVRRITAAVRLPVTADIEGGYGAGTPADVEETVREVLGAGAVGINLEDSPGRGEATLLDPAHQAERIAAARAAAESERAALFINARTDVYLLQAVPPAQRFEETVRRAHVYSAAGADGIFVPGVADAETIGRLVEAIRAPLNVMAGPGSPAVAQLRTLGVARVSLGPVIALSAMAHIRDAAVEVLRQGTYDTLRKGVSFPQANALFVRGG